MLPPCRAEITDPGWVSSWVTTSLGCCSLARFPLRIVCNNNSDTCGVCC